MTDNILKLMDVRRSYKNKNPTGYRDTQKEIRNKIRQAKKI